MSMSSTGLAGQLNARMRGPSLTIWLVAATVWIFILWAAFAWVDEIVRAEGEMISSSRPQIIQNLEGGILAELMVKGHSPLTEEFGLNRFAEGRFVDESVAAGVAH